MEELLGLLIVLVLVLVGLCSGKVTEHRHFGSLRRREAELRQIVLTNLRHVQLDQPVIASRLVTGHVVISTDYFKSLCASLRNLVGGRVRSFETLLERGRREAALRLKEEALACGAQLVLNVRFETMTIGRLQQGKGMTGVEVLAYGTAVRT